MRVTRVAGVATLAALATLAPAGRAVAGTTTTSTDPAQAAAGWLARQLTGPSADHYEYSSFPAPDYGNTADGVLAMDAAKVAQTAAARATSFLQSGAKDYATGGGYTTHYYAGSIAKLLLVAEAQHVDQHAFGGLDLPQVLHDEEQSSGAYANVDDSSYGSSVVDQSFALIALSHTGNASDAPDAKAVQWLEGQQCGDGSFQYTPQTTPAATCSDFDTTAYAAQALVAVGSSKAAAALDRIAAQKHADGGYGDGVSNANSTAIAVQALLAAGRDASTGLAWLRAHQRGCTAPVAQRGAVAFKTPYDAGTALRATTQAAQALAHGLLGTIDDAGAKATAPTLACAAPRATKPGKPTTKPTTTPARNPANRTGQATGATAAQLPVTGPLPVGPTVWIAVQAIVAGAALSFGYRRRKA